MWENATFAKLVDFALENLKSDPFPLMENAKKKNKQKSVHVPEWKMHDLLKSVYFPVDLSTHVYGWGSWYRIRHFIFCLLQKYENVRSETSRCIERPGALIQGINRMQPAMMTSLPDMYDY